MESLEPRLPLATITVTSLQDNLALDGQVTLREAIEAANTNTSVDGSVSGDIENRPDEIVFQQGLAGTIFLQGTELTVLSRLTIIGPGRDLLVLDARHLSRHFQVANVSPGFEISGLTLRHGTTTGDGGAILSEAISTTVDDCRIELNLARDGGGVAGIFVAVKNSTVTNNHATRHGGGFRVGSSFFFGSGVAITDSTVSSNSADSEGGGVYALGISSVDIRNSTISGNRAGTHGGGVALGSGAISVAWSTVAFNEANNTTGMGGGIYHPPQSSSQLTAYDSIIAQNSAATAPDLTEPTAPGFFSLNGVTHSLIGNNSGTYLSPVPVGTADLAGNLIGEPGALLDPMLDPLAANGGVNFTHALRPGSPAIDAGRETEAGRPSVPATDERGFPRIENNRIDLGAWEGTAPFKFVDDGTFVAVANNPRGFVESPIPITWNGLALGNQPYQAIELYHRAASVNSYPLLFADLLGNLFGRLAYLRADGVGVPLGTSFVGTPSFRTADRFHYIPTVSQAAITTGGASLYQSAITALFGSLAEVTSTRTFTTPTTGQAQVTVATTWTALQDITLTSAPNQLRSDRLRLFTASSMFTDETHFDADVIRYEDPQGVVRTLVLNNATATNAHLFPSAIEIGSWFELVKTGGSEWFPQSPTQRFTLTNKHGLRLGLQGYLQESSDPNDDSLSVWLEWLDAPNVISNGTALALELQIVATPPGTPGIVVDETGTGTRVLETGTTDDIRISLASQPRGDVTLNVHSGDSGEVTVHPSTVTFTPANWDQPQVLLVTGVGDGVQDGDQVSLITVQVAGTGTHPQYRLVASVAVNATTVDVDRPLEPAIVWTPPADMTYGDPLSPSQLNAVAEVAGSYEYSPPLGTILNAGDSQTLTVTFTPEDTVHFLTTTKSVSVNVQRAKPVVSWPPPETIRYGVLLSEVQLNATTTVVGTWHYEPGLGSLVDVGTAREITATFTPSDGANLETVVTRVFLDVLPAIPVIAWDTPAELPLGSALGTEQLDASSSIAGVLEYSPPLGTVLNTLGQQTLTVTFTPADRVRYTVATATVTIVIVKIRPLIVWHDPSSLTYGEPLTSVELSATSAVPGTWEYAPPLGTILNAGDDQPLTVTFTPADPERYDTGVLSVKITVTRAVPSVLWSDAASLSYGEPLSTRELNATAAIPGAFVYSPGLGSILDVGAAQRLSMVFTPSDSNNYESVAKHVLITVSKAVPTLVWETPSAVVYGAELSENELRAAASVPGVFQYTPGLGTLLQPGVDQRLSVTFLPTDTQRYETATASVLITVLKVTPIIVWPAPNAIVFGEPLSERQLNALAFVPGTWNFQPGVGTLLGEGVGHRLQGTFTPDDLVHYAIVTAEATLDVLAGMDAGDAPANYPVTAARDGARHARSSLHLGSRVDFEIDGQPSADSLGDGADEDGVFGLVTLVAHADQPTVASVAVEASSAARLDAWIDFNRDGIWSDTLEQIVVNRPVQEGVNWLPFSVPAGAPSGMVMARFRLSSQGGLLPTGAAADGEVEDHALPLANGSAVGGTPVALAPLGEQPFELRWQAADLTVTAGGVELFRAPFLTASSVRYRGLTGPEILFLGTIPSTYLGPVIGELDAGWDVLRLLDAGQQIDLTSLRLQLSGLEEVDLRGTGANAIVLDADSIRRLGLFNETLLIRLDAADTMQLGTGWVIDPPSFLGDEFYQQQHQGGVVLRVMSEHPWQNVFQPFDVNRDGQVAPIDVLVAINFLNESGAQALPTPTVASGAPRFSYDASGDDFIAPGDVLRIINYLNSRSTIVAAEGESDPATPIATWSLTTTTASAVSTTGLRSPRRVTSQAIPGIGRESSTAASTSHFRPPRGTSTPTARRPQGLLESQQDLAEAGSSPTIGDEIAENSLRERVS